MAREPRVFAHFAGFAGDQLVFSIHFCWFCWCQLRVCFRLVLAGDHVRVSFRHIFAGFAGDQIRV